MIYGPTSGFKNIHLSHSCNLAYSSPFRQNGHHFADDSFKRIFMNEKFCISIRISLKVVPIGLIENNSAFVQVMAWRRTGDKALSEPLMTQYTDAYMRH